MVNKVYISGPITGIDNYIQKFSEAERNVSELFPGCSIINPASYDLIPHGEWVDYMKRDIPLLLECDTIYLMKNWQMSDGAMLEFVISKYLELKIIFE